jgi:hypothetical protein
VATALKLSTRVSEKYKMLLRQQESNPGLFFESNFLPAGIITGSIGACMADSSGQFLAQHETLSRIMQGSGDVMAVGGLTIFFGGLALTIASSLKRHSEK